MNKIKVLANNLIAFNDLKAKRTHVTKLPTHFWIEPTNRCNLKCPMCPTGTNTNKAPKGRMDFSLYVKIIDEIKDYASSIILAVLGESMLHPQFIEMVEYASNAGIKVFLNTNASLLNKKVADRLLDSGIAHINFAFDGYNKDEHEQVRRGSNFEKTLGNIEYFLKLKKEKKRTKPYTVLSILDLELGVHTEEEKQKFLERMDGLLDEVRTREVSSWGETFEGTEDFAYRKNNSLHPPCARLWSTSVIAWNGTVLPCIYYSDHDLVLGNIKEKSFAEIWNDKPMKELRASMFDGSYDKISPHCKSCIVLGTRPLLGIPSGLRLTFAGAISNFVGFSFEKRAIWMSNLLMGGKFSSKTVTAKNGSRATT